MATNFLTRPPKLPPLASVVVGVVLVPIGMEVQGPVGGACIGAGVALVLMGFWDFIRLRVVAWWHARKPPAKSQDSTP